LSRDADLTPAPSKLINLVVGIFIFDFNLDLYPNNYNLYLKNALIKAKALPNKFNLILKWEMPSL